MKEVVEKDHHHLKARTRNDIGFVIFTFLNNFKLEKACIVQSLPSRPGTFLCIALQ